MDLFPPLGVAAFGDGGLSFDLRRARGPLGRGLGLMGRAAWPSRKALLLTPCRAIHTAFMRFRLDVVFLDGEGRVVRVARNVAPWRIVDGGPGARSAVEMTAGWLPPDAPRPGQRLSVRSAREAARSPGCPPH